MSRNTIALGASRIPFNEGGGGAQQVNPFTAGLDIMRMQQLGNENRKFQLEQQAYQALSQIAVQHPNDEEGAFREMMSSPWAPWGINYIKTGREAFQALTQAQEAQARTGKTNLEVNDTAMQNFTKSMVPYYNAIKSDASQDELNGIAEGAIQRTRALTSNLPKAQQEATEAAMRSWFTSQFANLPADPAARKAALLNRMGSSFAGVGFTGEDFSNIITGQRFDVGLGDVHTYGIQPPTMFGGPPQVTGSLGVGLPPGRAAPGEVGYPAIAPGASMAPGATGLPSTDLGVPRVPTVSVPNQLGGQPQPPLPPPAPEPAPAPAAEPTPTPSAAPPSGLVPGPVVGGARAGVGAGFPGPSRIATSDRTPLWTADTNFNSPGNDQGRMDASGSTWIWRDPKKADAVASMRDDFNKEGSKEYRAAVNAKSQLQSMDNSLDRLAGTPLQSGTLGAQRTEIAKGWNTAMGILHSANMLSDDNYEKAKFNEGTVAESESFLKNMRLLQFSTVTQNFGAQREAAQVIMAALQGVPGVDNSYLGGKLVLEGLRTAADRVTELRDFQNHWIANPANHGDLTGSVEEFNRIHPPEVAAQQVMDKFGLSRNGFTSQQAIDNAVSHGWVSPEQAAEAHKRLPAARPETVSSP